MPFLLPAVTAAVCDIGILYLHHVTYNSGGGNLDNSELSSTTTSTRRIYQGSFIVPLAIIRLFLLVVPYPYHSFKGKALRCPLLYRSFYAVTFLILFVYSLALLFIDPQSLATLLPGHVHTAAAPSSTETTTTASSTSSTSTTITETTTTITTLSTSPPSHDQITMYLWWSVVLTFGATLSHVALFYHVRSTAPSDDDQLIFPRGRRRPKVLLYYVKNEQTHKELEKNSISSSQQLVPPAPSRRYHTNGGGGERGSLLRDGMQESDQDDDSPYDYDDGDSDSVNEPYDDNDDDDHNDSGLSYVFQDDDDDDDDYIDEEDGKQRERRRLLSNTTTSKTNIPSRKNKKKQRRRRSNRSSGQKRTSLMTIESLSTRSSNDNNPMQEISSKIISDLQTSLAKTKLEWTKRLEEYQFRSLGGGGGGSGNNIIARQHQHQQHSSTNGVGGVVAGTAGTNKQDSSSSSSTMMMIQKVPPTPFRVILELFAGENVLSNGRLDAVYNADDGAAVMFFIPQLLSFLLHGALESSSQLEEWILDKSRKNVFFAHKCYWFLRAWALESTNLSCGDGPPTPAMRLRKSSSLASFEASAAAVDDYNDSSTGSFVAPTAKLLPEEYAVIEDLMRRIMECGEEPARLVHFGPMLNINGDNKSDEDGGSGDGGDTRPSDNRLTPSPSALMSLAESGGIPIDPSSGMPSAKHFECLAASRRYGFLPMDNALTTNFDPLQGNKDRSYFDATPVFLDALLTIADELFKVPREIRTSEFRKQLNLLEVEALPSNDVYIPLQDPYHRVWRIVSDESIAISTKERVPCIVCLEVVDYSPDEIPTTRDLRRMLDSRMDSLSTKRSVSDGRKLVESERETISRWFFNQRDPHRRETALEKLTNSIGNRLVRMPGKLNTSMRSSIEKLKTTNKELQDLLTIKVPETFSMDDEGAEYGHIPSQLHTHEPMPVVDIERGEEKADQGSKPYALDSRSYTSLPPHRPPRILGPSSPRTSRSSANGAMGQWTSPAGRDSSDDLIVVNNKQVPIEDLVAPNLKRRSYQSVGSRTSSRGSLRVRNSARASASSITVDVDTDNDDDDEKDGRGASAAGTPSKPPTKPPPVIFKESWIEKEDRLRAKSAIGDHPGWRLLPVLVKSNDDLRQEQLASQLIYRIALILARERIPVWLCPYEILALESHGGIIEAIPDTISIASLKKNDPNFTDLKGFFHDYFDNPDDLADAKANFCESLAAYSVVCFLLQIKDRHNGNILLDNRGHLIHIDFGFFFLSSPGKNTGFESAPFKLTREWVELLGGVDSHLFAVFRTLCYRTFIALRKHCHEIILLVEMLKLGNEDLKCFRGRPDDAISELRQRFRLDLNDRACFEYVNSLVDNSLANWTTDWYDRYQRLCVGIL